MFILGMAILDTEYIQISSTHQCSQIIFASKERFTIHANLLIANFQKDNLHINLNIFELKHKERKDKSAKHMMTQYFISPFGEINIVLSCGLPE